MSYLQRTPSFSSMIGTDAFSSAINVHTNAQFLALYNGRPETSATLVQAVMPVKGTIRHLYVNVMANGSTTDCTLTLMINGVDTALSVTMSALVSGVFFDLTHSVSVNAGDLICFHANQSTTNNTIGTITCELLT